MRKTRAKGFRDLGLGLSEAFIFGSNLMIKSRTMSMSHVGLFFLSAVDIGDRVSLSPTAPSNVCEKELQLSLEALDFLGLECVYEHSIYVYTVYIE